MEMPLSEWQSDQRAASGRRMAGGARPPGGQVLSGKDMELPPEKERDIALVLTAKSEDQCT